MFASDTVGVDGFRWNEWVSDKSGKQKDNGIRMEEKITRKGNIEERSTRWSERIIDHDYMKEVYEEKLEA